MTFLSLTFIVFLFSATRRLCHWWGSTCLSSICCCSNCCIVLFFSFIIFILLLLKSSAVYMLLLFIFSCLLVCSIFLIVYFCCLYLFYPFPVQFQLFFCYQLSIIIHHVYVLWLFCSFVEVRLIVAPIPN